ncbi:MAG TPA: glycosyltransferase [Pyrinomonadaceae bacterium]|nr:glycosyltransferase [Pyrinomonadaceae bacterium]
MPIKSVHITNYYHKNSGGISTSYNNLLEAANRHRRYIHLIVPGEKEDVENIGDFGKIYYIPAKYSPIFDRRYRVMMPWQYMLKDTLIRRILLEEKPDMIEVTDKYTLSLIGAMIRTNNFRKLGRPMLVHFSCERMDDNIGSFLTRGRLGKWFSRRVIGNYTLPNFDFHIANSPYTAEEFYESFKKFDNPNRSDRFFNFSWRFFKAPRVSIEERVFVCPRGVNVENFSPEKRSDEVKKEMRQRADVPENSIILLYAGRISPEKNIGLLLDFMKILAKDEKDYRLLVAGAGPQADWLKGQAEKNFPNKIKLLGHLDKDLLAAYYANADVFVHPNPREPFGIAPLEAMASGVPVVAPNSGGILSYADNENAWLVEPKGENFAAAIREIIEHPELREHKIEKALETARKNTWEVSTDRLLATYDKMYEDFQRRNEFFTDRDAAKSFDYSRFFE